jgi:hypothetical protein
LRKLRVWHLIRQLAGTLAARNGCFCLARGETGRTSSFEARRQAVALVVASLEVSRGALRRGNMSTDGAKTAASDLSTYLDEIAKRLWSGHAAVMIGSGFSKNAVKAIPSAPPFPTWDGLGDCLYEKLHGQPPKPAAHYLDPLRLASEVQAAFGRPALEHLLRTRIPDLEYQPSDLHVRLLELPWTDVFTVNYDTLLERAADKVAWRRFDVVVNQDDLVYATRPRIIKLHGSFPSTRPLIVSEEDYRCYPVKFAAFVNTVQQSLLENTLCLIGFSGDDPNFLHWIGWVRDNLGTDRSPRMYLIGLPSLTAAQRCLLEQRNIVIVDLASILSDPDSVGRHARAFEAFFSRLRDRRPSPLSDWPSESLVAGAFQQRSLDELLRVWRASRVSYPNWVVAPRESRDRLLHAIRDEEFGMRFFASPTPLTAPYDLELLFELNWMLERALLPIYNDLLPHYERLLRRYNPFPLMDRRTDAEVTPDNPKWSSLDWAYLTAWWVDLQISLLRLYREEGLASDWTRVQAQLEAIASRLTPEQTARWYFERSMDAVFSLDLARAQREIEEWPSNPALPFWEAKRAALLAELGNLSEAAAILERALAAIRAKQQLAPVGKELTWVSQESHVMYLLRAVRTARELMQRGAESERRVRQQFRERWNELKQYQCDPWDDLALFKAELDGQPDPTEPISRESGFDIGSETVTHHLGRRDAGRLGYSFLRYCEEVGIPFAMPMLNIAEGPAQVGTRGGGFGVPREARRAADPRESASRNARGRGVDSSSACQAAQALQAASL